MTLTARHPEFAVHKLNEEGFTSNEKIRDLFNELLSQLESMCVQGREFSLVKTKLEEACFFAKKSNAINLKNQQSQE